MLNGVTGHLMRRGFDAAQTGDFTILPFVPNQSDNDVLDELKRRFQKPTSILMLAGTFILFIVLTSAVEYAIRVVAVNLAIVEDTTGNDATKNIAPPAYTDEEPDSTLEKAPLLDVEETGIEKGQHVPTLFPQQPITRKLRTTMRHVKSVSGFKGRFPGVKYIVIYSVLNGLLGTLLTVLAGAFTRGFAHWIGFTLSSIACSRIHAAWTHAVIAAPSDKSAKRCSRSYLPKEKNKHLILPTLRLRVAHGISGAVLCSATMFAHRRISADKVQGLGEAIGLVSLPFIAGLVLGLFVILPAHIALIRTEAALFPENENAIVPLDRSFGGRVVLEAETRRQYVWHNLSLPGAYKTFDKDTYKRVLKMHVKLFAIILALGFVFVHALAFEVVMIVGDMGPKIAEWAQSHPELFEEGRLGDLTKRWIARK